LNDQETRSEMVFCLLNP